MISFCVHSVKRLVSRKRYINIMYYYYYDYYSPIGKGFTEPWGGGTLDNRARGRTKNGERRT